MVTLLLAGILCGFCSSAPLGPINLWLIQSVFERRQKSGILLFLSGVIVADLIYAGAAAWGQALMNFLEEIRKGLIFAGGIFLLLTGVAGLIKLQGQGSSADWQKGKSDRYIEKGGVFVGGMMMCGSNPAFLMFWLLVFQELPERTGISPGFFGVVIFLAGVATGDALWFFLVIRLARLGVSRLGNRILGSIRLVVSLIFIGLGAWFLTGGFMGRYDA